MAGSPASLDLVASVGSRRAASPRHPGRALVSAGAIGGEGPPAAAPPLRDRSRTPRSLAAAAKAVASRTLPALEDAPARRVLLDQDAPATRSGASFWKDQKAQLPKKDGESHKAWKNRLWSAARRAPVAPRR